MKALDDLEFTIHWLIDAFHKRGDRIKELEDEGSCRFNCRTQKQWRGLLERAYNRGFDDGMCQYTGYIDRPWSFAKFMEEIKDEGEV